MAADQTSPVASTAPPTPGAPRERQPATIRYVDRPDISETFADSVSGLIFDGQSLRIEFAVTRLDEVKPNMPITGRRYPACRLVLAAGRRGGTHQPHATDRGGAHAGRRDKIRTAPW